MRYIFVARMDSQSILVTVNLFINAHVMYYTHKYFFNIFQMNWMVANIHS